MASRKKKRNMEAGIPIDMTPMIDIVFLLIAFFMIVSDLSKLEFQTVILPIADAAREADPQPGERTVILNVVLDQKDVHKSHVRLGGDDTNLTVEELTRRLKAEAISFDQWIANPDKPDGEMDSRLRVLVRCDQFASAGTVHTIYQACQKAKIYRVSMAALSENAGARYK